MANDQTTEQQTQQTQQTQVPADKGGKTVETQQTQTQTEHVTPPPVPGQKNSVDDAQQRGLIADLQKERQARQKLEQQFTALNANLEAERRRVQALAGVTPKTEEDVQLDEIRARIVKMFPVLGRLDEDQIDELLSLKDHAGSIEEATQHHWTTHGRSMLSGLNEAVAKEIGSDLSDRQKKALGQAYVAAAEADPAFLQRHEQGDPKLIEEFAKAWIEDWFEPARKQVVTTEAQRFRRVPNGRDRNVQTTPPKAVDFKNPKAVEDAMVESFRRHGGSFDQ